MNKIPVFDIGDTLLPDYQKINEAVITELKAHEIENPPELPINEFNIYKTKEVDEWLEKNNLPGDAAKIKEYYLNWERDFLKNNVIPELEKINDKFGPIGFISDNSVAAKEFYIDFFKQYNIDYKGFIVSEEVGVEKPNPQIFEEFLNQREEPAERFVYFGNYVDRDKGAEKVGMHFVWVTEFHLFDSSTTGNQIRSLNFKNVKKALFEVEE